MLRLEDGSLFTSGVAPIRFGPASSSEKSIRAIINVKIEGFQTEGFIDTGGVFFLINPEVASAIGITPDPTDTETLLWRGIHVGGSLHRMNLGILASDGSGLRLEATAFVPFNGEDELLVNLPCILGLQGCLDRMKFAIDPSEDKFYFGPIN